MPKRYLMTDYKNELPQDSIEQIEQDLAASFEQFRQAEGAYLSATSAASTGAAHVFVQRFLRHSEALLSQHSKKRELEAETKLLEHLATSDPKYTHAAVMDELGNLKYELNLLEGEHIDIPGFEGTLEQLDKLGVKK